MTDKEKVSGELSLRLKNYSRVLVLASGGFLFGFYLGAMNALGVPIIQGVLGYDQKKEKDIHNTIYGMTNFLFGVGSLIGNVSCGKIANAFGRREAFYMEIGLIALAIAPSLIAHTSALLISRFLIGVSVGINLCIYNVILAELLPNKLCGIGGSLGVFFLTLGLLLSSLCQNIWEYSVLVEHWRWFVIYPIAIELMRVVAFPFVFKTETPAFIFNRILKSSCENQGLPSRKQGLPTGDQGVPITTEPLPLINKLYEENRQDANSQVNNADIRIDIVTQPDASIKRTMNAEAFKQIKIVNSHIYPRDQVDDVTLKFLNHMEGKIASREPDVGFKQLFSREYRRQFFAGCFLGLGHELCGTAFFSFYSTVLFDEISGNGKVITLVMGIVNIVIAIASIFSVAYIGRKPNLVIGSLLQSVGLLVLLIGYKTFNVQAVLASTILYVTGFCLGLGGAQLIYLGETLPPTGVGIAFGIQSAFSAMLGLVIPLLVQAIGPMPLIIFFMVFCFAAIVICQVYLIETRNKTAKAIFDEYNASLTHVLSCPKKQENESK